MHQGNPVYRDIFYLFQHCSGEMIHCSDIHHKKFKQGVLKNNCLIFLTEKLNKQCFVFEQNIG